MPFKVLLVHPGTQHARQLAKQLHKRSLLYQFWTGFALAKSNKFVQFLLKFPDFIVNKISNRVVEDIPYLSLKTLPIVEWNALRKLKKTDQKELVIHERNKTFQEKIPDLTLVRSDIIIGFDTSSWILAQRAKKIKKKFILDQSIAHPLAKESVFKGIAERYPAWNENMKHRLADILTCEKVEYELADKIVVGSSFTKNTLVQNGICKNKININPYGVDLKIFTPPSTKDRNRPFRFLFVGSVSARKGIPLLLEAWQKVTIANSELWIVGPMHERNAPLIPQLPNIKIIGKVAHRQLPQIFSECDVFVFPSYFEGFALVLLEALASGLPIITTEATAGPDLIENGKQGFIMPSGSVEALCKYMRFFDANRDKISEMSFEARKCAEKYSWDAYGERWEKIINELN